MYHLNIYTDNDFPIVHPSNILPPITFYDAS